MLKWTNAPSVPKLFVTLYCVLMNSAPAASPSSPTPTTHFENRLSVNAPSASIIIRNHSSCPLKLLHIAHDNNQTKLTLPELITGAATESQYTEETGHISFSGGYFSSMQQRAVGTYQVTCENKRHLLTLSFFIAPDHYTDGYFIDKTFNSQDTPVILYPPGKTTIVGSTPIILTLINKEVTNDSRTEPDPSTDTEDSEIIPSSADDSIRDD